MFSFLICAISIKKLVRKLEKREPDQIDKDEAFGILVEMNIE